MAPKTNAARFFIIFLVQLAISLTGAGNTVINYTNAMYGASSQNWSVSNCPGGFVFVGNEAGLLEFDGSRWILHQHPEKLTIRSVLAVNNNLVYTGAFDEFGVWERDEYGKMAYRSLVTNEVAYHLHNDDIWNILQIEDKIYFQSFSVIFLYKNGAVSVVGNPQSILFLSDVGGRLLIYSLGKGICEVTEDKMHLIEGSEVLSKWRIPVILSLGENRILFGTESEGLYLYDGEKYTYWDCEGSDYIKKFQLNRGITTNSGLIILGTIQNGLIIIDTNGKKIREINSQNGLQNNTILGFSYQESTKNLWIALNRGIDLVNLESVYINFQQMPNTFGTVFTALYHNEILYLGTNQGLYCKLVKHPIMENIYRDEFMLIPGSQGQVWELKLIDDQILCGHNNGTYVIEKDKIKEQISDVTGGWNMKRMVVGGKNYLIQSTYTRLVIYEKNNQGHWKLHNVVDGFSEPVQHISVYRNNSIWASHTRKGVYRIELSKDLKSAKKIGYYGKAKGLPSEYNVNVYEVLDEVVFATTNGFYTYDGLNDTIVACDMLNNLLEGSYNTRKITHINDSTLWITNESNFLLASLKDRKYRIKQIHPNQRFQFFLSERNKDVVMLNDSVSLLILPSGFVLYNYLKGVDLSDLASSQIILREIYSGERAMKVGQDKSAVPEIPYRFNEIRFLVSSPGQVNSQIRYQYKLVGLDTDWNTPVSQPEKLYAYLPSGNYIFMARTIDDTGRYSEPVDYRFRVLSPWYFSIFAIAAYIIFAVGISLIIRYLIRQKYLKEQERIQEQHEKEKLQAVIDFKVKQLAGITLGIINKNEVLQKLKTQFLRNESEIEKATGKSFVRSFLDTIEQNLTSEDDWKVFEDNFDHAHSDFIKRIRARYEDVTPGDLKMCAYLRMNLTSKEIASMLNLSVRSVEIKRYRLRKKLRLPHDSNLNQFMMEF